jgi:glycosyltransferase involved in cell wall biosynthesis
MPYFSFVICTRNRCAQLEQALHSISRAVSAHADTSNRFDLVLVDNGSTDNTAKVFDNWARQTTLHAKRVFLAQPGLAASRNAGVAASAGDILIFTDDDCVLTETYCSELCAHLSSNPAPRILGGRVALGRDEDLPFTIKLNSVGSKLGGATHPGGFILGCNMIIPRSVLLEIGNFDERFGAGARYLSGEETDILYRAHQKQIPVEYVPDMTVYHFHGRSSQNEIRRLNYSYHFGTGALYSKYFFSNPRFSKHLYWALKSAIRELAGGTQFEPECNLSYWTVVRGNLAGISAFAMDRISDTTRRYFSSLFRFQMDARDLK